MLDSTTILDLRKKHQAFFNLHKNQGTLKRIQYLKKLKKTILKREEDIQEALFKDLKKPAFESFTSEILMVYKELDVLIKNTKEWSTPVRVSGNLINFPSQDYLFKEPYGTLLIISPWNYPFQLALLPVLGAVAAGNTVVLKPSEFAPHTSKILCELLESVFPSDWVTVIEGDSEVAQRILNVQWDYIFFTGSTHVGKIIAQSAAQFLTPYTLELGGKSPCIVDGTTPLQKTAKRIVWGKFLNCGQTCIAPDYLLVKREFKAALIQALIQEIKKAFGDQPDQSKDYGRIIHQKHFEKLAEDLKGQTLLHGGTLNRSDLFISPTLVDEPSLDSQLMEDEIFGPILPILNYENEDELDPILSKLKNPLAFYVFSKRKKFVHSLLVNHAFGGAVVNDSIIHFANNKLPFGGIGNSGTGAYHGKFSFDTFSHSKPVVKRPFWFDLPQRFAPFPKSIKNLKTLLKRL